MNSLDLYDFTVPVGSPNTSSSSNAEASSSNTTENSPSQPSLNEEVTQVIGQLGRLWGGVRKQSQTAFESARKDLGQVVTQAQKELEKLGQRPAVRGETVSSQVSDEESVELPDISSEPASQGLSTVSPPEATSADIPISSSFLSRIQSSLPPNFTPTALSATLQRHLPENLQHGLNLENANADFVQLRTTLAANIQRVQQGTTVQQAEKLAEQYMHKGEALFKEAGEFLKDAVKVVPPEDGGQTAGVVWDGTDVWTMPTPIQTNLAHGASRKGKDKESDVIFSVRRAAAKRADVLLKKLRNDPDLLRKNPELDDDVAVKDLWSIFVKEDVEDHGGIGGEFWTKRTSTALEGLEKDDDAKALTALRDLLVPAELTTDTFWTRYFFRVHQIEREEERRKALLAGANQDDDEFSWEDEDDGEDDDILSHSQGETSKTPVNTSSSTLNASPKPSIDSGTTAAALPVPNPPASSALTPASESPRDSEDSYDVVSSNVSSTGGGKPGERRAKESGDTGDDSDWE